MDASGDEQRQGALLATLVDVAALDPVITYDHAFVYIREIAIALHGALNAKDEVCLRVRVRVYVRACAGVYAGVCQVFVSLPGFHFRLLEWIVCADRPSSILRACARAHPHMNHCSLLYISVHMRAPTYLT